MTGADPDRRPCPRWHTEAGRPLVIVSRAAAASCLAVLGLSLPQLSWGVCATEAWPAEDAQRAQAAEGQAPWAMKFRMASQVCTGLHLPTSTGSAASATAPREAAQLALYT